MRRIITLLLAAGIIFGYAGNTQAVDFKAKGQWVMAFDYGQNGGMTGGNGRTGFDGTQDEFEAQQRLRLQLDAVASENLSATVLFEIGTQRWGMAEEGGALGADGQIVKLKNAYLDWTVPNTELKVRMGISEIALPSATMNASQIYDSDSAGVTVSYQFNDYIGVTAFWARLLNDNIDAKQSALRYNGVEKPGYFDNVDMFALSVPITFDGIKATPFFAYTMIGPNAIRMYQNGSDSNRYYDQIHTIYPEGHTSAPTFGDANDFLQGMFPVGASRLNNGMRKGGRLSSYANAWWAGFALDITRFDPWRIAFDFNYGSVKWDDSNLNREGWLAAMLVEYKFDWVTPGLYGWYASGDDGNVENGSERMPYMAISEPDNEFAYYALNGAKNVQRAEGQIAKGITGTWGIGLRLKDMSFMEDLKHTLRVVFMGGTNSASMGNYIANKSRGMRGPSNDMTLDGNVQHNGHIWVGMDNFYLTTKDHAMEVSLSNTYQMYENFQISLDAAYVALWLDHSDSMWGPINNFNGAGGDDTIRDMWNVNLSFIYSF